MKPQKKPEPAPERLDIFIPSQDSQVAAWIYLPAGESPVSGWPTVIMGHGFGGVRHMRLPQFAEHFQAAGFAVIVFDYRNLGDSPGEPRGYISPKRHTEDYISVIDFATADLRFDPGNIALWGVSFSGGHSLMAAVARPQVKCLLGLVPFVDAMASGRTAKPQTVIPGAALAMADTIAGFFNLPAIHMGIIGEPGEFAMLTYPGWLERVTGGLESDVVWDNRMALRSLLEIAVYRPGQNAGKLKMPVMWIYGKNDKAIPAEAVKKTAANIKDIELHEWPVGHLGPFEDARIGKTLAMQTEFLEKHLQA